MSSSSAPKLDETSSLLAHQKKLQLIVQQKLKFLDASPTELNDSGSIDKTSSSRSHEPGDSAVIEKLSSILENKIHSSPPEHSNSGTRDKVISSSSSKHGDSGTLEKVRSFIADGPQISDGPGTLENMYEDLHRTMTLKFISSANEHQESMETCKKLHKQGLVSKEKYSEFKTLSNKSSKEMKYIIRNLNDLFKDLIDHVRKEVTKRVTVVKDSDDEPQDLLTNDDMLCRSLALSCLKDSDDESNKAPQNLAIIDGILEKGKQARKCANWYLYRACNLEILCDDILYTWIFNSLGLTNYANIMDISLRVSDGVDKEKMYSIYTEHHKDDFEKHYLRKLHQGEIELEKSDKKYKKLEARKPRFVRSRLCMSEHSEPFCEPCGWPNTWLKTFKKKGIYIKEAPHWTTKHIWYNEIKDE